MFALTLFTDLHLLLTHLPGVAAKYVWITSVAALDREFPFVVIGVPQIIDRYLFAWLIY